MSNENVEYFTWNTVIDGEETSINLIPNDEITLGVMNESTKFRNETKSMLYILEQAVRTDEDWDKLLKLTKREFMELSDEWNKPKK